jgi:hypothetical protein
MEKAVAPTSTVRSVPSLTAARLSFASSAATLVLLAALHFLSPEFDPSRRMVSEYAVGDYRWALSLMFLTWALSCVSLFFAIWSQIHTLGGKIGLVLLLVSAAGTGMAAFFHISHRLHGLAFMIGIPSLPVAALLISRSLLRKLAGITRRSLLWTANLPWMSMILMVAVMFIGLSQSGGEFGSNVLIGWPNRLVVLAYCGWLMAAARGAILVEMQRSGSAD